MNQHSKASTKKRGQEFYDAIKVISDGPGLTAVNVEKAARRTDSPLHDYFTWDDTIAALQYRIAEARDLIASIVEHEEGVLGGKPFRSYLNLRSGFESDSLYHPIRLVMSRKAMRDRLLAMALQEAESWRNRYRTLKELAAVFSAIRSVKRPPKK